MKNFFLSLGAVIIAVTSQSASATSVQIPTVLEYVKQPLGVIPTRGETMHIVVYATGQVYGTLNADDASQLKLLRTLTPTELQQIQVLVDRARVQGRGLVSTPPPVKTCRAVPTERATFTAGDDRFVLEQVAVPCGVPAYNDTRSSLELVQKLRSYETALLGTVVKTNANLTE